MHRSTLTLRRFGPMSFGLGYYENGTWVDHAGSAEGTGPQSGDLALDAVHEWYGCCADSTAARPSAITDRSAVSSSIPRAGRPSTSVVALMSLAPVRAVEK
jgi:hypothetical protein